MCSLFCRIFTLSHVPLKCVLYVISNFAKLYGTNLLQFVACGKLDIKLNIYNECLRDFFAKCI